jgi:adenosylhomocysteinase
MRFKVKDLSLASKGKESIEWAESRMPVLLELKRLYSRKKSLKGVRIAACLHVTKETAVLARLFKACGASLSWCGCNPLSTQDEVASALVREKVRVFAWRGLSEREYYWCIKQVLKSKPNITLDDGADLVFTLHKDFQELIPHVIGGTEETTTGVNRLRAMHRAKKLLYPIIAVNEAETKWDFDNILGTGQSSLEGIMRATHLLIAGKNFVVAGYGHCGRGIAMRARGLGAKVVVTEVDPIKALKARMEGFEVMPMGQASRIGDIFITATGCKGVIRKEHMLQMKDGVILCNAGHFNVEVCIDDLEEISRRKREVRKNNVEYTLKNGRRIYLLAEGRLVNLVAAEGHPSEIMDMSFANQFLAVLYLVKKGKRLKPGVYAVPREQDQRVAELKLKTMGIRIDKLSQEQRRYLESWEEGT